MDEQLKTLIELSENGYNLNDFYVISIYADKINLQAHLTTEKELYYRNMGHHFEPVEGHTFIESTVNNICVVLTPTEQSNQF